MIEKKYVEDELLSLSGIQQSHPSRVCGLKLDWQ